MNDLLRKKRIKAFKELLCAPILEWCRACAWPTSRNTSNVYQKITVVW